MAFPVLASEEEKEEERLGGSQTEMSWEEQKPLETRLKSKMVFSSSWPWQRSEGKLDYLEKPLSQNTQRLNIYKAVWMEDATCIIWSDYGANLKNMILICHIVQVKILPHCSHLQMKIVCGSLDFQETDLVCASRIFFVRRSDLEMTEHWDHFNSTGSRAWSSSA